MSRMRQRATTWTVLGLGFAFLYIPVIILMVYSFNESRLATVWSGFSLASYSSLWDDPQLLPAAWLSARSRSWRGGSVVPSVAPARPGSSSIMLPCDDEKVSQSRAACTMSS